jgi:hypothetical protein
MINKKTTILISAILIVLLTPLLVSAEFLVSFEEVTDTIQPFNDTPAVYEIIVDNLGANDVYDITADATSWIISPSSVSVNANSSKTFTFEVRPTTSVGVGIYRIETKFESRQTGQEEIIRLPLSYTFENIIGEYVPNVALTADIPESIDPREKVKLTILLRNRNLLNLKELTVDINSPFFTESFETELGPRAEKSTELWFDLPELQDPGDYELNVKVKRPTDEQPITELTKTFRVEGYSTIEVTKESDTKLFKTTEVITLTNNGNIKRVKNVKIEAPFLKRLFMSSDPKAEVVKEDGKAQLSWDIALEPEETRQITLVKNYTLIPIIIIVIIIIVILYFLLRSPIILLKEAKVAGSRDEGISKIKIRIFIKNRSSKKVHKVRIIDKVSSIAEMIQDTHIGTMQPTKVTKSEKRGTIIRWEIEGLEPYEERIVTYKIRSKLKILGDLKLPGAKVKFETMRGKERTTVSPVANVGD